MKIGEITLSGQRKAMLSCRLPAHSTLRATLMDQASHLRWEQYLTLDKTTTSLEFQLPVLENGQYHLWITVNEQRFIRTLTISGAGIGGFMRLLFASLHRVATLSH